MPIFVFLFRVLHDQILHSFGAKKIAVIGLSGVGCAPTVVQKFGGNPICSNKVNNEVQLFNDRLQIMVSQLNKDLSDAKFTYVNVSSISAGLLPQIGNYLQKFSLFFFFLVEMTPVLL